MNDSFDLMIGRLDHILSRMLLISKGGSYDPYQRQTLKQHAEDMIGAGHAVLNAIEQNDEAELLAVLKK
jgi:hypothetical protein